MFAGTSPASRISKLSADNVEIVHTNAGLLGFMSPLGHADFYANGGKYQIGCGLDVACSHSRAYELYAESLISKNLFYALKCIKFLPILPRNCPGPLGIMGTLRDRLVLRDMGAFYFQTNPEAPFAKVYFSGKKFG